MPKVRTPRPRTARSTVTLERRGAARAMLWRIGQVRSWKVAVHAEAWRQAHADGSHGCGPAEFDAAESRLQAGGVDRPPDAWFDEVTALGRLLAREGLAADRG